MRQVVIATNNPHKVEEIRQAVNNDLSLLTLSEIGCEEEIPEEQETLAGNALQKARFVFEKFRTGCFADDTGLEVDALNFEPGVHSARYAGPQRSFDENIDLLLKNLSSARIRSARFRTVIAFIDENGVHCFEGVLRGTILKERKGLGGFGYDPVFLPAGSGKTLAEMTTQEKNRISHRGIAVRKLADFLRLNL